MVLIVSCVPLLVNDNRRDQWSFSPGGRNHELQFIVRCGVFVALGIESGIAIFLDWTGQGNPYPERLITCNS